MGGKGPAPKPANLKRRRTPAPGFRLLPHAGRVGETPSWPIGHENPIELEVWAGLWRLPQAAEWERLEYFRVVARYCRTLVAAEMPGADQKLMSEVRQLEDRLGLTPRAMQTLRWETDEPIEEEEEAPKKKDREAYVPTEAKG